MSEIPQATIEAAMDAVSEAWPPWVPFEAEMWPIIEHEPEREPVVPPDLKLDRRDTF